MEEGPPGAVSEISDAWTDDLIERCLALALAVLPLNALVLRDLAQIFCNARSDQVKRTLMRAVDAPVRQLSPGVGKGTVLVIPYYRTEYRMQPVSYTHLTLPTKA